MTVRVTCNNLINWSYTPENSIIELDPQKHFDVPGSTASVKLTARPGTFYEAIAQYALPPTEGIDLSNEPIMRIRLNPSMITAAVHIQIILISGDLFDQVNIGKVMLDPNSWNTVDIDLRTVPAPFNIKKWRGTTVRYYLSGIGATPSVNIDWIESLSGLPDRHIIGTVADELSGAPLANVNVSADSYAAITQSDGTYDLFVPSGKYTVSFSRSDYYSKSVTVDVSASDIVLNIQLAPLPPQAILTIVISPPGSATTNPSEGSHSYNVGSEVPVTVTPASGFIFDHWELDGTPAGISPTISISLLEVREYVLIVILVATPTSILSVDSAPIQGIEFSLGRVE